MFSACIEQQLRCMLNKKAAALHADNRQQLRCMLTEPGLSHQMALLTGSTTGVLTCDRCLVGADCSSNTCISSTDGHPHVRR